MAKWGEGDPRWIVEERPDATNVNNWHWTEKNASDWSKIKIKSLFLDQNFEAPGLGQIKVKDIPKCDGEAMVNNRKGKLIFFYEWSVEIEWEGKLNGGSENEIEGKIEFVNFSEENEPHEIDINVSVTKGGEKADKFKEFIRKEGIKFLQNKVGDYIQALKDEYASNIILPTKNQEQAPTKHNKTVVSQTLVNNIKNIKVSNELEKSSDGTKFTTTSFNCSQTFKCTVEDIFRAFTVREMMCAFTKNDVKVEVEKGGKFELFGGNVCGEFTEIDPNKRIVQKWRFRSWPDGHYSEVSLDFKQEEDCTKVSLKQSGVPVSDFERTKVGWQNYYWDAIKRTFGFGAHLM